MMKNSCRLFKKLDKFSSIQMLRYKEETEYGTITGALMSILVIGFIFWMAKNIIFTTLNKEHINWNVIRSQDNIPTNHSFELGSFKFGAQISGLDLNDPNISYFDVVGALASNRNGYYAEEMVPMGPCNAEDWNVDESTYKTFTEGKGNEWICPQQNLSIQIGGAYSLSVADLFRVDLYACGTRIANKTNCASQAQVDALFASQGGHLVFYLYTINTFIQPEKPDAIIHYLDQSKLSLFSKELGVLTLIDIAEYQVQTDQSLFPFKDTEVTKGELMKTDQRAMTLGLSSIWYSGFVFQKAQGSYSYKRSYTKIDATIAYIGGLISMVMVMFVFMLPYTELCYEFSLCNQMYFNKNGEPLKIKFDFLKYIFYQLYTLLKAVCCCCKVQRFDFLTHCSQKIQKELDIAYLIKRVNTLQRAVTEKCPFITTQALRYRKTSIDPQGELEYETKSNFKSEQRQNMDDIENEKATKTSPIIIAPMKSSVFPLGPKSRRTAKAIKHKIQVKDENEVQVQVQMKNESEVIFTTLENSANQITKPDEGSPVHMIRHKFTRKQKKKVAYSDEVAESAQ